MTRVVGLLLFGIAAAACSSKATEPKVDPKAVAGFTRVLTEMAGVDPTQSAALLADGAYKTVAPSEKCFESFAAAATERARIEALLDCGLACTLDAIHGLKGKEPRSWMAALAATCEPAHFGLEKADAAMLSPEWFLLHKIGQIAAPHFEAARGADRTALDKALAAYRLPLPLPAVASGLYELSVVPAEVSVPVATRTYLVVPAKGALRVGATPFAMLGPRGAATAAPEGRALFPGNEVARADLRALVLEAGGAPAATPPLDAGPPPDAAPPPEPDDPAMARKRALDAARSAGVLGKLGDLPAGPEEVAGLRGDIDLALRGDLGGDAPPVPLLLADGAHPAADVIDIAGRIDRVLVAVASPDDPSARALAVELVAVPGGVSWQAPGVARISLGPGGLEAAKKAAAGAEESVLVRVEGDVPWRDAMEVAATAITRGAKRLILASDRFGHGASGHGPPARSVVSEGEVSAGGGLDTGVVKRVVRARLGALRACYERELEQDRALAGQLDLAFTIGPDGSVVKAKGSGLGKVADCASRQLKVLKFPPPPGGAAVNVRYPLLFKPKDPT